MSVWWDQFTYPGPLGSGWKRLVSFTTSCGCEIKRMIDPRPFDNAIYGNVEEEDWEGDLSPRDIPNPEDFALSRSGITITRIESGVRLAIWTVSNRRHVPSAIVYFNSSGKLIKDKSYVNCFGLGIRKIDDEYAKELIEEITDDPKWDVIE